MRWPALFLAILVGCGGGSATDGVTTSDYGTFGLTVLDGTFAAGGAAAGFSAEPLVWFGGFEVNVRVSGAAGLRALYARLTYDPTRYSPLEAEAGELFWGLDDVLLVTVLHDPGVVHLGLVLAHPEENR